MSQTIETDASGSQAEAASIAQVVEQALEAERSTASMTSAQKADVATGIYTSWRNQYLRGMSTQAFAQVEAGSAALIAAIAAQL
jgi:hypothetical protein